MANFNVNVIGSFVTGTAANDTFNISAGACTVLGLDGDDTFNDPVGIVGFSLSTAVPATIVSISASFTALNLVLGGDGNDMRVHRCQASETTCPAVPATIGSVSAAAPARQQTFSTAVTATTSSARPQTPIGSWAGPETTCCKRSAPATPSSAATATINCRRTATPIRWMAGPATTACLLPADQSTICLPASATTGWAQTATFMLCPAAMAATGSARPGTSAGSIGESGDDSLLGVGDGHRLFGGDGNDWVGVSGTPMSFSVMPATTTWPPPVTATASMAAPATTRWSQRQDTQTIATSSHPVPGRT